MESGVKVWGLPPLGIELRKEIVEGTLSHDRETDSHSPSRTNDHTDGDF